MKSWISVLLPDDEYKEKKMMQFLSEGAVLLFISLIGTLVVSNFIVLDTETILFLHIALFAVYVLGRYIVSGIEFTDIVTEQEYRKERRVIIVKSAGFTAIFILLYSAINGFPADIWGWLNIGGVSVLAGVFMFLINFISLRRSYKKNRDLT